MPARGVERWLAHRLAAPARRAAGRGDGVCAHVAFPSPGDVVAAALDGATGVATDDDPWQPARAVWPLHGGRRLAAPGRPWCARSAAHLDRARSRFAVSRTWRACSPPTPRTAPSCSTRWRAGDDADVPDGPALAARGVAGAAGADRRARTRRSGSPPRSPALRRDPALAALPERLSLFGPTRLPAGPPGRARRARPRTATCTCGCRTPPPRCGSGSRRSPTACRPAAPTRPPSSRATRCSARSAATSASCSCAWPRVAAHRHRTIRRRTSPPATLLRRLQRDLRDDGAPAGDHVLAADDRSVQVHACHGPHRQVEVLREIVLGLLADDPTLEPRDVLIACPDVETFAPLVSAAFGLDPDGVPDAAATRATGCAVRLADRALRQVNPLLDVVGRLLELADARLTASEVLDLLAAGSRPPPLRPRRRRPRPVARPRHPRRGAVGAVAPHPQPVPARRRSRRTPGRPGSTGCCSASRWRARRWLGTALPLDDVESGDVDRLGRLAEFVDRLTAALDDLSGERPLAAWVAGLSDALDALTADHPGRRLADGPGARRARRAARAAGRMRRTCRSHSPTCAGCWPSGCAGGRAGRTSAPAPSRSRRWCRCGRSRTG